MDKERVIQRSDFIKFLVRVEMRDKNLMEMAERLTELIDRHYKGMPDMALYKFYKNLYPHGTKGDFLLR